MTNISGKTTPSTTAIDVWSIVHGDLHQHTSVDYAGDIATFGVGNAIWLVKQTKSQFHQLRGKHFIVFVPGGRVYYVTNSGGWKAYAYSFSAG